MLFRFFRWLVGSAALETQTRPTATYVSQEQLDAAIEQALREVTYEWNEMYEKFNALHLRLSKRVKREQASNTQQLDGQPEGERPMSVLNFRRLGSV